MALCGFNKKMLEGLKEFFDGAIEHGIIEKAKKKNISTEEQFQNEYQELSQWLYYARNVKEGYTQKILEGLALVVAGVFEKNQKIGIEKYKETHKRETEFLNEVDNYFYEDLKGDKDGMNELFEWVNKNAAKWI